MTFALLLLAILIAGARVRALRRSAFRASGPNQG
jgi:hypothetical protein